MQDVVVHRVTLANGTKLRLETNSYGIITYAEKEMRKHAHEYIHHVRRSMAHEGATVQTLSYGEEL